jgi:hypothetical protein
MLLGDDQAQRLQLAQRLADRALADLELLGDVRLDDPVSRLVVPVEDPPQQGLFDVRAQRGAADRQEAAILGQRAGPWALLIDHR